MTTKGLKLWTPAEYRIRVQGILDPSCSGRLADQVALMGVLDTLYNYYHCPLLSVEYLGSA
jgi:hypothetical protein